MEIVVSLGVLGIVIVPLMNMFVFCHKVLSRSHDEYESIQLAQLYMEEIKAMAKIDEENYSYLSEGNMYERVVDNLNYQVRICIIPEGESGLHWVEINVHRKEEVVNDLLGSVILD